MDIYAKTDIVLARSRDIMKKMQKASRRVQVLLEKSDELLKKSHALTSHSKAGKYR
jgi:F420-0:gamma-glutamyl ligase